MPNAAWRFSGVADEYDAVRPSPPADLLALIMQWAGVDRPDLVDLGAGTGLSAVAWAGRARHVTAVEPSGGMRRLAERRIASASARTDGSVGTDSSAGTDGSAGIRTGSGTRFRVLAAGAEETGLPDGCADVVTASQAMHWFDPDRALPEIARLLRPGGVLAAYDCDWPPWIDWETAAAWERVAERVEAEERRRGIPEAHQGKDHLGRLQRSGLFRHCAELAVHGRDRGGADRLVGLAFSVIANAADFLADGTTEDELGFTALREVAARRLSEPTIWWWTYRVRLAVR
jgi:SAM-dependent methyltransferase